jgi:hypothetical protein
VQVSDDCEAYPKGKHLAFRLKNETLRSAQGDISLILLGACSVKKVG